jgi:protein-disulfide isomerase
METNVKIENPQKKKWYKRSWGIFVIILGALLIILLAYFFTNFFYYYNQIKDGKIILPNTEKFSKNSFWNSPSPNIDALKIFHDGEPGTENNAPLSIVGFFDFRCPYSIEVSSTLRELQKIYGEKVNFVFRNFPVIALHPDAMLLAQAGECAHLQKKFWPMYDKIFANKNDAEITKDDLKLYAAQIGLDENEFIKCLFSDQSKSLILEDVSDAEALGVRGTPTWFLNNQKIEGVLKREDFQKIIDKLILGL